MLKYKCKYTAEFFLCVLVVVGVHVVCCCIMILLVVRCHFHQQLALCDKTKIKPPCHMGGCRNTWQYDTYYQHCWWKSFVRTDGEDKGGWPYGGGQPVIATKATTDMRQPGKEFPGFEK